MIFLSQETCFSINVFFFFDIIVIELKPILMRLELSKEDYDYMLDPFQILFTQAQINSYFSGDDGFTVEDTINDLISGSLKVKDLPTIRVCLNKNDQYISADNRRLFCYREAIRRGANFTLVPVRIVRESDESCGFR